MCVDIVTLSYLMAKDVLYVEELNSRVTRYLKNVYL